MNENMENNQTGNPVPDQDYVPAPNPEGEPQAYTAPVENPVPPVQPYSPAGQSYPGYAGQNPYSNPYRPPYAQNKMAGQPGDGMAIASLILGISGVLLACCGFGIICGILAVIFGILSYKKKTAKNGMVLAGLILGGITIVISIIAIIGIILAMPDFMRGMEEGFREFENIRPYEWEFSWSY